MKNIFIAHLLFGAAISNAIIAQETITNSSIIKMKELGFNDKLIMDKINHSETSFNTSIEALTKLKNAGVSAEVISLVMRMESHNTISKTGIYYVEDEEKTLIQPSVFSGTNSNSAAQKLISGFINSKVRAQLPRTSSSTIINSTKPEFLFVFDPSTTNVGSLQNSQGGNVDFIPNWWFRTASNPNEFVLVKLTVKARKNVREVIIGKKSEVSSSTGVDPKMALPFSIEEIEANKFKVIPQNLEPGEYCFIYQGQVPQGRDNQSVFDFSIQ